MSRQSKWSFKYPPGAISSRDDLLGYVIEARKTKRAFRLYVVEQMGAVGEFIVTPRSKLIKAPLDAPICRGPVFDKLPAWRHFKSGRGKISDRYYRSDILMGSYSVGVMSSEHHRMFLNKRHAENYASELKSDPEYVLSVKEHWARCKQMFGDF